MSKQLKALHAKANKAALAWSKAMTEADRALAAYKAAHEAIRAHNGPRAAAEAPLTETDR